MFPRLTGSKRRSLSCPIWKGCVCVMGMRNGIWPAFYCPRQAAMAGVSVYL